MSHQVIVSIRLEGNQQRTGSRNYEDLPKSEQEIYDKFSKEGMLALPEGTIPFPEGSLMLAQYPSLIFALNKETVALRHAISFMQSWITAKENDHPDITIAIHSGEIETSTTLRDYSQLNSKVFLEIEELRSKIKPGCILVSDVARLRIDQTSVRLKKVSHARSHNYWQVNYLDPRSVDDSSLAHAIFVAHASATKVRDKAIVLFLVEYAMEYKKIIKVEHFIEWANNNNYIVPPKEYILKLLKNSELFNTYGSPNLKPEHFELKQESIDEVNYTKKIYYEDRESCLRTVSYHIHNEITPIPVHDTKELLGLIDDYLASVFSEIRMMANYFRETQQHFSLASNHLSKFDYIIRRSLNTLNPITFHKFKTGFLKGLDHASKEGNTFIASVFHNVLATYYLNRNTNAGAYQIELLKKRVLYLDTNIIYSRIPASNFHEVVKYTLDSLGSLGIVGRVFPFTVEEYESSLQGTCQKYRAGDPHGTLAIRNPWIIQEFEGNQKRYLNSMRVCQVEHSILKNDSWRPHFTSSGETMSETQKADYLQSTSDALNMAGYKIENDYSFYNADDALEIWTQLREYMTKDYWSTEEYYEFMDKSLHKSNPQIQHDVACLKSVEKISKEYGEDALGPIVLFVTVDYRSMMRLRDKFPFIVDAQQLMEFLMPYLFLANMPLTEPTEFPNKILNAQLGTLLVAHEPETINLVKSLLTDSNVLSSGGSKAQEIAQILSSERFAGIKDKLKEMEGELPIGLAQEITEVVEFFRTSESKIDQLLEEKKEIELQLEGSDKKIEKLNRTLKYWKQQARKKH